MVLASSRRYDKRVSKSTEKKNNQSLVGEARDSLVFKKASEYFSEVEEEKEKYNN